MAELSSRQSGKERVVFRVRRGDDNMCGLGELEEHALKRSKPRRVQRFEYFDDRSRIESAQPPVAVHERTLDHIDTSALLLWKLLKFKPVASDLDRAPRNVHAENLLELGICHQQA